MAEAEDMWSYPPCPAAASAEDIAKFAEAARGIVSAQHVLAADASDEVVLIRPQLVVSPGSEQELASILKLANDAGLAVIPRGGGTKLGWGEEPKRADVVVSTARLNRVLEHAWADLTVTVEAGCTLSELQELLGRHGQRLALDALWPERATVGGVLSTNDSGALRLRFGGLRDLIIGITLALADGTLAKSGGKVVKNVAGYDLPKLVTGALGTLGVITRAVFRLHPTPKEMRTISIEAADLGEAQRMMGTVQDSQLAHSAMQMRCGSGMAPQVDMLFEGISAGLTAQVDHVKALLPAARIMDGDAGVWKARQDLFETANRGDSRCRLSKISVLPATIAKIFERLGECCGETTQYEAVVQATGIGHIAMRGDSDKVYGAHYDFFPEVHRSGGSLVLQNRSAGSRALDMWGPPSDLSVYKVMHAVKQQFDPRGTLNPGRFVDHI
jgi:glycolate oxidase FAD binding subunit